MNQANEIKKSDGESRQISLINQQIISNFKFSFPCPSCDKEISDEDFAEEQKAFNYLASRGKEIFEKTSRVGVVSSKANCKFAVAG